MTNKTIKPIETVYNGFRFRSRLEARWAVVFDELGVRYQYELEGFSLPSGAAYLPDFYLPDLDVFVEVKPTEKIPYESLAKMIEFVSDGNRMLLLICGIPGQQEMFILNNVTIEGDNELRDEYEEEEAVEIQMDLLHDFANVQFGYSPLRPGVTLVYKVVTPPDFSRLEEAMLKGKQARFEFGERG